MNTEGQRKRPCRYADNRNGALEMQKKKHENDHIHTWTRQNKGKF